MNRIKELRKEKGMTQLQLADALGIPRSNITRYENGSRKLNGALVRDLCEFFGCSANYLQGFTDVDDQIISEQDRALLRAYHAADSEDREIIDNILGEYRHP